MRVGNIPLNSHQSAYAPEPIKGMQYKMRLDVAILFLHVENLHFSRRLLHLTHIVCVALSFLEADIMRCRQSFEH